MSAIGAGSDSARGRNRFDWALERLLHALRPHRARRLAPRERRVETAAAATFLVVAGGMALLVTSDRAFSPWVAAVLVVGYALASRVRLYVGTGFAMPTQLVLVPMLFWLPAAVVPMLVACALVGASLVDAARGRAHPETAITGIANAWYTVGASAVFVIADEPAASNVGWGIVALALAAQCAVDLLASTAREWLGRGIPPALQLRVIATVYLIDVCLTPVAVLAADSDALHWPAIVAVLLLLAFLAAFAAERRARIEELTTRLDELEDERQRHDASIRRVGEAYGSGLDRPALVELVLRTAVDALRADRGRASAGGSTAEAGGGPAGGAALDGALVAAEESARRSGRRATAAEGSSFALAHPLAGSPAPPAGDDVIAVARAGAAFSEEEQALLAYLAAQMAVALENVALHERLGREARIDELTGLANHRDFQESLKSEIERLRRFRRSLALVMVDIDAFKLVNDTHGHQQGDEVLRRVAAAIRAECRATDVPARYGGEEIAVVMPETDLDGAFTAGEGIRRAVEALSVPLAGGGLLKVTVSVGVAATGPEPVAGPELIAAADGALYEAKRSGRNRTVRGTTRAIGDDPASARR
jgi:diguanylate cyclase (GGDEF)-like protein